MLHEHMFIDRVNEGKFIGRLRNREVYRPINLWGAKITRDSTIVLLIRSLPHSVEEMQVGGGRSTEISIYAKDWKRWLGVVQFTKDRFKVIDGLHL